MTTKPKDNAADVARALMERNNTMTTKTKNKAAVTVARVLGYSIGTVFRGAIFMLYVWLAAQALSYVGWAI